MVEQQTYQFACRVSGSADDSYFNHIAVSLGMMIQAKM